MAKAHALRATVMHKLLLRQLKRHVGVLDAIPANWRAFIDAVNESYYQADADRALLEHSLELSSQELMERNRQLQQDLAERQHREAALHQAEQERLKLQDEIIHMQAATLEQLSTPLIPISDDILVMPLIGTIDPQRADLAVKSRLAAIEHNRADVVIMDVTGVPLVDTHVGRTLLEAAQAARLLGASTLLVGLRPEVAQTIVGLGLDLSGLVAHADLQSGLHYAMAQRRSKSMR